MTQKDFNTFQNQIDDRIDLAKLLRSLLMQSKMIIAITFIVLILAIINFMTSTRQYQISSLLQVESFNQNMLDPTNTVEMMSPVSSSSDLDNLITLYRSRTNIIKLINDLKLNISFDDLLIDEHIDLDFEYEFENNEYYKTFFINIEKDTINIFDENETFLMNVKIDKKTLLNDDFNLKINKIHLANDRLIKVNFQNPDFLYESLKSALKVNSMSSTRYFNNKDGLIEVSLVTDDIDQGKTIIDYANGIFINQRLSFQTEKSRAAIQFLDDNIKSLESIVDLSKKALKEFLEENKLLDVDLETQAIIDQVKLVDKSLADIDIELSKASDNYTSNNPLFLNLLNKKAVLESQKNTILAQIKSMPKEQQEYIELYNDVESSQTLFEELENRRLGFSIMEASTISDIRIVDKAYVETLVSPQPISIIFATFIAFLLSCVIAIIRGISFLPLSNPAELFDNNFLQPMVGVIPFIDDIDNNKDDKKLISSIESIIVNIQSIQGDDDSKKVVLLTSPSPANGKSTVSSNLAETFASIGKKVLLIDSDYKRGVVAKNYNLKSISEKTFLGINNENLSDIKVKDNLYVIPRVKGLANSFQFVLSKPFLNQLEFFRAEFDYIIMDSAPILSVADSSVLLNTGDMNFLVVRHGATKINEIRQSNDIFNQLNSQISGFIYNAYAKPQGYYGYYGLYGNYSYQYYSEKYLYESYDYKDEV